MAISHTNQENIEKFINYSEHQIEKEKKELGECQKNLSNLLNTFSQKAPSSSVINSLFKDEEPEGFVFSKYEDKRKQLAEQRRAEYNAFLEKKEAEHFSKKRNHEERRNLSAKSILDSVDYDRVLAKRKEEEAQFRNMNVADVLQSARPVLNNRRHKSISDDLKSLEPARTTVSMNTHPVILPGATMSSQESLAQYPPKENRIDLKTLEKQNAQNLEEMIAKRLEEQRRLMLLEFDEDIRKNNLINKKENRMDLEALEKQNAQNLEEIIAKRLEEQRRLMLLEFDKDIRKINLINEKENLEALEKQNAQNLEEIIAKRLEEQRRLMLLEFEKDIRKNNLINEELQNLQKVNSAKSDPPKRIETKTEEFPMLRRTGGGGEPVKDSYGNMITMRGLRKENDSVYGSSLSLPSMMHQPAKDRMALYREELQRQIEEKRRLEALEKNKALELEERLNKRMEEQLRREAEEFEKEQKKTNRMKQNSQLQDERTRQLMEFQQKDEEERRRKMAEKKPPSAYQPQPEPVVERSTSPPIPAVRTKVLLEKAVSPIELFKEVKPDNPLSTLAEIRRKIKEEQQKSKKDFKNSYEVMNRRTVQEVSSDDEDDLLKTSYQSIF